MHIKKQRHYFVNKSPSSQGYGFSSSHVWMWELDYKESWALKNWCFWTVVLERTLESPLDCKEIQPVHPKGDQSWVFIAAWLNLTVLYPSPAFHIMYSAYKLNKQGDNIQPWHSPFSVWNQSVVPCLVLTVASWPAHRFLRRQVRWSGIPISWRIFQFVLIHRVKGFDIVNKAEVDVFLEFSCFSYDPSDVGNLISGSSAFQLEHL